MNSTAAKILSVLISLFMIAYVGYQAFLSFYDPYETEIVKKEQYIESVQLNGFFVRNEQVIPTTKNGVIGYNYKNAQKISRNSVVANVYTDKNDLYNLKKIELLKKQKAILEEAHSEDSSEGLKLDLLSKQISEGELAIVQAVDNSDLSTLGKDVYKRQKLCGAVRMKAMELKWRSWPAFRMMLSLWQSVFWKN